MVERKEDMSESAKVKDSGVKNVNDIGEDGLEVEKITAGVKGLTMSTTGDAAVESATRRQNGSNVPEESDPDDCGVDVDSGNPEEDPDSPAVSKEEPQLDDSGLEEGIRGLVIDEGEIVNECSGGEKTVITESEEDAEVGDTYTYSDRFLVVARGQGDGSEHPDDQDGHREPQGDGHRDPQEDGTTESEDSEKDKSIGIVSGDVKAYIRIDKGPNQLKNGRQLAQIGAHPSFDFCDVPLHQGKPGEIEIVARAPEDAYPTARAPAESYKRKGRTMNMTGGGIVGGNETNMPLGFEDHRIQKAMRPMPGSGGFTTSSRSGMSGGSVQAPGMPGHLPQINDPLLVPSGPLKSSSLPPIDAVWHQQFGAPCMPNFPRLPNMPNASTAGQQQQIYQFGNRNPLGNRDQFQNADHEKEVYEIENYLRTSESDFSEKPVASPYGGSSGIGSPGSSMSAASPGSAYSDGGDRMHKQSDSSEDEGLGMGHLTPRRSTGTSDFDINLDIITELIDEKMGKSELSDEKVQAKTTPVSTQESVLKSQLIQPPIYAPPSSQNYGQQCGSQLPPTTSIVTTTASVPTIPGAVIVGVVYNVPNAAPMKKGPVPILPKPEGGPPSNNMAMPPTQPKKRVTKKAKNSKSKASPTPKSGSPKSGPDSVFFAPSPDGSSSDASMYASSCQMSPNSNWSVSSPGSCGLPSTLQDTQFPMTIPGVTTFQNGPTNFQGVVPMTMQQGVPMLSFQQSQAMAQMGMMSSASSQGVYTTGSMGVPTASPTSVPASLSQNVTMTTTNAISSTGFAPKMEPMMKQESPPAINDPYKFSPQEGFPKPVAMPPQQKKANRPGLKIDTTCCSATNGNQSNASNNVSLTPVPASPSTPTTMSRKSRASCITNSLTQAKFEMIDSDGDSLLHQFTVHGDPYMIDAFLARCKRQGCLEKFINLKNYDGQTPLYLAALVTEAEIVRILLEYGADVTITNNDFTSPLHCAAQKCQFGYEILDLLLTMPEKKADLSGNDEHGLTPLHIAIQFHGVPVEDQSVKTENNNEKKLVPGDSLKTVELLFRHGANAHDKASKDGRNALHFAIERKSLEMMSLVLRNGDARKLVTDTTGSGNTGLHIAAGLQMDDVAIKKRMIQLLVTNGAELDARNRENNQPKDLVDDPKNSGAVIVELLKIQRSRNISSTSSQSSYPASPPENTNKQRGQNATLKMAQIQSQRSSAGQGVPTTNAHENFANSDVWRNPEMMGYMNSTMQNAPEQFVEQTPLYGQGLCETSDNSLEAIVTSLGLDNVSMGQMSAPTNVDQTYTQELNALYSQLGGEQTFSQSQANSGMEQPYAMSQPNHQYAQNTVQSTSGMGQQYSQTLTGASANMHGYTPMINQQNLQPYSQSSQIYSQQFVANQASQPVPMLNQYHASPATTSIPAAPYPQSYPDFTQPGRKLHQTGLY